jgi:hypothetical protein
MLQKQPRRSGTAIAQPANALKGPPRGPKAQLTPVPMLGDPPLARRGVEGLGEPFGVGGGEHLHPVRGLPHHLQEVPAEVGPPVDCRMLAEGALLAAYEHSHLTGPVGQGLQHPGRRYHPQAGHHHGQPKGRRGDPVALQLAGGPAAGEQDARCLRAHHPRVQ